MNPRRRTRVGPTLFTPRGARAGVEARVVAGIDEAGLGPLLGPLTIGCAAFRIEPGRGDLWSGLSACVAQDVGDDEEKLVVADSKVVFTRDERSKRRLERTTLAFEARARDAREACASARAMLEVAPSALRCPELEREPWYPLLPERLFSGYDGRALDDAIRRLACASSDARVECLVLHVRTVPPCVLNASFEDMRNKSLTHWGESAPILLDLWNRFGPEGLDVVVDRHGGRMRYAPLCAGTFPRADVEIVREQPEISEYRLSDDDGRRMRVVFAEKAERLSFSVALASCAAKYAREVCMSAFNAYFGALQPELRPTAGYLNDAWRWMEEAVPAIERSGIPRTALVRER